MIKRNIIVPFIVAVLWITVLSVTIGCKYVKRDKNHTYSRQDVVYNVNAYYDFESKHYLVYDGEKEYKVHPNNYYLIKIDEWQYTDDHKLIYNEFYVKSLELFEYYRQ